MASINLAGVLRNPDTTLASGGEVRLIHRSNTGEVIAGFRETLNVNDDGTYDFSIQYGNVFIQTRDVGVNQWTDHGTLTINQDTSATTLPELLNAAVPPTEPLLLELQNLLSDANEAANRSESAAASAEFNAERTVKVYQSISEIQSDSSLNSGKVVKNFEDELDYYISETLGHGGVAIGGTSPQVYANPAISTSVDWDVEVEFNDGIQIQKGYGTIDANGNKVVGFSRASATTNINKSGAFETLAADEPAIGPAGINITGTYENLITQTDVRESTWGAHDGAIIDDAITIKGPDGITDCSKISFSGTDSRVSIFIGSLGSANAYNCSSWIYSSTGSIRLSPISTHEGDDIEIPKNKWTRVSEIAQNTGSGNLYGVVRNASSGESQELYVFGPQVTATELTLPFVNGLSSADIVTIPTNGNLPEAGKPFSICIETSIPTTPGTPRVAWSSRVGSGIETMLTRLSSGNLYFYIGTDDGETHRVTVQAGSRVDDKCHLFACIFDGDSIYAYQDGNKVGATLPVSSQVVFPDEIYIGSNSTSSGSHIDSSVKSFKILHRALSESEIKAMGGPR